MEPKAAVKVIYIYKITAQQGFTGPSACAVSPATEHTVEVHHCPLCGVRRLQPTLSL